jgi:hypothetical protein
MQNNATNERFASIPHHVMDSVTYIRTSHRAKALLLELCRQLTASNNGQLQATTKWLKNRGWSSHKTIQQAKNELLKSGLITKTRNGGFQRGADLFGVSWRPIIWKECN